VKNFTTHNLIAVLFLVVLSACAVLAQGPIPAPTNNAAQIAAKDAEIASLQGQLATARQELAQATIHRDVPRARRASGNISHLQGQLNALGGRVDNLEQHGINGLPPAGQTASNAWLQDWGYKTQGQLDKRYVLKTTDAPTKTDPASAPTAPPTATTPAPVQTPQAPAAAPLAPPAAQPQIAPLPSVPVPVAPATIMPAVQAPAAPPMTGAQVRGEVWRWAVLVLVIGGVIGLLVWLFWPNIVRMAGNLWEEWEQQAPAGTNYEFRVRIGGIRFRSTGTRP